MPHGSQRLSAGTRKDQDFQQFETQLIRRICSIFGVQPASIGYAGEQYKVSQEGSHDQTSRFGVGAVLLKRKELYDETLESLGYDDLEIVDATDDEEDGLQRAQRLHIAVGKPWMLRNEARAEEGNDPVEGWDEEDAATAEEREEEPSPEKDDEAAERNEAIGQWERIALRRLSRGQSPAYTFRSDVLPEAFVRGVVGALEGIESAEEIRAVFRVVAALAIPVPVRQKPAKKDDREPDPDDEDEPAPEKRKRLWLLLVLLIEETAEGLRPITEGLAAGESGLTAFVDQAVAFLGLQHAQAAALGRRRAGLGGPDVTVADLMHGQSVALSQVPYLQRLGAQLQAGSLSKKQLARRLKDYGERLVGTANDAWRMSLGAKTALHWRDVDDSSECDRCHELAKGGPYTPESIPTMPGKCETPCFLKCRCYVETEQGETSFYDPADLAN